MNKTIKRKNKRRYKRGKTMNKRKMKGGEGDECNICLFDLDDPKKEEITLNCTHKFHKKCIFTWCTTNTQTDCGCPSCRRKLHNDDKKSLNIQDIVHRPRPGDPGYHFESTEQFKQYINRKLRGYTSTPLRKLNKELDKFLGTDVLPVEFIGGIMVFELQTLLRFKRYKFIRLIQHIPFLRSTTKYFEYKHDDDAIAMELVEK